ncbi:MAG TPA: hypothetical protein VIT42_01495 [Microlunatus sp.]
MSARETEQTGLLLHPLTFVAEPQGVMVGRAATGSYAVFPEAGAEAVRRLMNGASVAEVANWYKNAFGSSLDMKDLHETLADLGFLRQPGDREPEPVRWQRLGRWAFSAPAWICYVAVTLVAVAMMIMEPTLRPSYRRLFFTSHLTLISVGLTLGQFPCVAVHEFSHALAGRRLGLPSRFSLGRRLYYLVAETQLTSLYSVSPRQRYLPFLAGMLADVVMVSSLTVLAGLLNVSGAPGWLGAFAAALAFTGVLRLLWQFLFYLETDLYFVISTAVGSSDLQNAARYTIRRRWDRLVGATADLDADNWTSYDLRVARCYAPLLVLGYGFSIGMLLWVGLPSIWRFLTILWHRFDGTQPLTVGVFVDSALFVLLSGGQLVLLIYFTLRDWRARQRTAN